MRGRDAARKLTLKGDILEVFTIDFSEIQFYRESQLAIGWTEQKCKEMDRTCKRRSYVPSLYRGIQKIPRTMVSHLEQVRQKWAYETSIRFSTCCLSLKNRLHRESGEQVAEPISPQQFGRWHPFFKRFMVGQVWMELVELIRVFF